MTVKKFEFRAKVSVLYINKSLCFFNCSDLDSVILTMDACLGGVNEPFTNTGFLIIGMILMNIILTVSSYINNNITFVRSYNLSLNILKTVLDNYASAKVALLFSNNPIEYLFL